MVNAEELENEVGINPDLSKELASFFNDNMDVIKSLRKKIAVEMDYVERDFEFITPTKALEEMRILSFFDQSLSNILGILDGE